LRATLGSFLMQLCDLLRQLAQRGSILFEAIAVFVDCGLEDGDLRRLLWASICCDAAVLLP
jgi:hypothetical protein